MIGLQDLLPQGLKSAKVSITIPKDWELYSSENESSKGVFDITDLDRAVFHAGKGLRKTPVKSGGAEIEFLAAGEWLFTDPEAAQMADSVFASYSKLFGVPASGKILIAIRPFPVQVPRGQWEADSRGSAITIMSSDMPFKNQSLQRLHEQLRHEVFHLWIPNAISLTGNYDWFYEGFALYNSLKTGVAVNRISFNDFLDTLGRAYEISSSSGNQRPLIQASAERWNGSNTLVYARGMLVAFACDIAIIRASNGKRSVSEVLKRVFVENRGAAPRNANESILSILSTYKELKPIADGSIAGSSPIDWKSLLPAAGLQIGTRDQKMRIAVADKLSGSQKEVLDRLGYNNWRKLPRVDK
jgi:predicted metalloprotease with PDZ domain